MNDLSPTPPEAEIFNNLTQIVGSTSEAQIFAQKLAYFAYNERRLHEIALAVTRALRTVELTPTWTLSNYNDLKSSVKKSINQIVRAIIPTAQDAECDTVKYFLNDVW